MDFATDIQRNDMQMSACRPLLKEMICEEWYNSQIYVRICESRDDFLRLLSTPSVRRLCYALLAT